VNGATIEEPAFAAEADRSRRGSVTPTEGWRCS
jgi:hypothetical protein